MGAISGDSDSFRKRNRGRGPLRFVVDGFGDLPSGLASSNASRIANGLGEVSGGSVLDVATGGGGFIETMMRTLNDYQRFVGIDICDSDVPNSDMESERRRFRGEPVRFLDMDAEHLDFEDETFDTVSISHSLHHLAHVREVLDEMKRVLKPKGHFIVQESYRDGDQSSAQKAEILKHDWEARIDHLRGVTHNRTFCRQRVVDIVESLALRELEVFDSTHAVDCLYCDKKHECENPKNQAAYHMSVAEVDGMLEKVADSFDTATLADLRNEGDRIKSMIEKTGLASASYLFFIIRK